MDDERSVAALACEVEDIRARQIQRMLDFDRRVLRENNPWTLWNLTKIGTCSVFGGVIGAWLGAAFSPI